MRKKVLEKLGRPPSALPRWVGSLEADLLDHLTPAVSKPRLRLLCGRDVASDLAKKLRQVAAGLTSVSPPAHHVRVIVLPSVMLDPGDGQPAHGYFVTPSHAPCEVASVGIAIATGFYEAAYVSRTRVAAEVLQVLGHEYAHYEQWRDGKPVTERGVEVRGRNLVAAALKAVRRDFNLRSGGPCK